MSLFELIEGTLVAVIVGFQIWFFRKTAKSIETYKEAIPDVYNFQLIESIISREDLKQTSVSNLLEELPKYEDRAVDLEPTQTVCITILKTSSPYDGLVISTIIRSINTYLVRNKGAVSDFNLLRDITQRNLDMIEEEISVTTPIPVYLGLIGTMLGIIIGLFALPDVNSSTYLEGNGIAALLNGVKIAMGASAIGLIVTVYTNGWLFKGAKNKIEQRKNDFFTFLQTELLPVLSESVNAGVVSLNRNLDRFGDKFGNEIGRLNDLMERNQASVLSFQSTLGSVKDLDILRIARFNIEVMKALQGNTSAIEQLGIALGQVHTFVANSRMLVERTQDVLHITSKIEQVLNHTESLQKFLNTHFDSLQERGLLIKGTVTSLDQLISREIKALESHIQARLKAVTEIKINEDVWLQKNMRANQTALSNLTYLESLDAETKSNTTQQREIADTIKQLSSKSDSTNALLTQFIADQKKSETTETNALLTQLIADQKKSETTETNALLTQLIADQKKSETTETNALLTQLIADQKKSETTETNALLTQLIADQKKSETTETNALLTQLIADQKKSETTETNALLTQLIADQKKSETTETNALLTQLIADQKKSETTETNALLTQLIADQKKSETTETNALLTQLIADQKKSETTETNALLTQLIADQKKSETTETNALLTQLIANQKKSETTEGINRIPSRQIKLDSGLNESEIEDYTKASFYLITPTSTSEGKTTFFDRRSDEVKESSSCYAFNISSTDSNKADFWFVNHPNTVSSAIAYPDRYLKPACDYSNAVNTNAKQIVTDRLGKAELMGKVWEVKTKALIRFI